MIDMPMSLTKRQLLERIDARQQVIIDTLGRLRRTQEHFMADMDAELANLTAKVERTTTLEQSAIGMIGGLGDLIRARAGDPAALRSLADTLDSKATELAAALTSNTPEEPPAEPPADTGGDVNATPGARRR